VVESFLLVVEVAAACCWEVVEIHDSEALVVVLEVETDLLVAVEQSLDLEEVESDSCCCLLATQSTGYTVQGAMQ
jgi:hypothetical protein